MARITVEDCLQQINNRFDLVMVASKRARDIALRNAPSELDPENDKPTVLALREIASGHITSAILNDVTPLPNPHHESEARRSRLHQEHAANSNELFDE